MHEMNLNFKVEIQILIAYAIVQVWIDVKNQ